MAGFEALRNSSPDELRASYGEPSSSEQYRLGDVEGLFRSSTANLLPGGAAANGKRRVWELIWTKAGCDLTVRFLDQNGRWGIVEVFKAEADTDY